MSSGNRSPRLSTDVPVVQVRVKIVTLHFQAAPKVHFIGLDDATIRVLRHPHDAGERGLSNLPAGGFLVRRAWRETRVIFAEIMCDNED